MTPTNKSKLRLARLRALEDFENYLASTETIFLNLFNQRESLLTLKKSIETLVKKLIEGVDDKNQCSFEIIANVEVGNRFISHSIKSAMIAVITGKCMQLPEAKLVTVTTGALLHDVGKVRSKNPLLGSYFARIQGEEALKLAHPTISADIAGDFLSFGPEVAQAVRNHHEQLDGSGYPRKVFGGEINILDRVVFTANLLENLLERTKYEGSGQLFSAMTYSFNKFPWKFDNSIRAALQTFMERPPVSRRGYERLEIVLSASYHTADSFRTSPCRILDLSGGGARMRCKESMELGLNIVLNFAIGHTMTFNDVRCKVVRRVPEEGMYVYGLVFQDKSGTLAERIDRYVQRTLLKS